MAFRGGALQPQPLLLAAPVPSFLPELRELEQLSSTPWVGGCLPHMSRTRLRSLVLHSQQQCPFPLSVSIWMITHSVALP